jgi:protein TonB
LSFAFFAISEKGEKDKGPFFAQIITPEEVKKIPPAKKLLPKSEEKVSKELAKMPKLPKELSPPKELSSIPSTKYQIEEKRGFSDKEHENIGKDRGSESPKDSEAKKEEGIGKDNFKKPSTKNLKEKIFDREIIGKLSKGYGEGKKEETNSLTFDTKEFRYYGYLQRLKEKIEGIWRYPSDAAEKGIYGDLYIKFTIKKDGKLGAVELVRTSGYKSLDDAAIKAIKDAEPYWPLPEEWGKDGFTITGHFIYTLYGAYIR